MKAVSGLDVHKDTIFACILQKGNPTFIREYSTLTCGIFFRMSYPLLEDFDTTSGMA